MGKRVEIAYIPLDDRPVNFDQVHLLARMGGVELLMPPQELLGSFTIPGDSAGVERWMATLPRDLSHLIVSLDMLCYGGLLASRKSPAEPLEEAAARSREALKVLETFKESRANVTISALGVLLRSSISVLANQDLEAWRRIHELATSTDARASSLPGLMEKSGISPEVAATYTRTRGRNMAAHHTALDLVRQGTIDYLLLCQEDAAPHGIHCEEQAELSDRVAREGLATKVSIQPGADEGGMLLLARTALSAHRIGLAVQPEFGPGGPGAIPLYESCSVAESLLSKLNTLGAKRGFGTRLYLHTLEGSAEDIFRFQLEGSPPEAGCPPAIEIRPGWAVADLSFANGADSRFVESLLARTPPLSLSAFAAWNTASNSIGSVLAHLAMREIGLGVLSGREAMERHVELLAVHWADDWVYQSGVRGTLVRKAQEAGLDGFNLGTEGHRRMQATLEDEMGAGFASFAAESAVGREVLGDRVTKLEGRFTLPWPRLFEIRSRIRVELA